MPWLCKVGTIMGGIGNIDLRQCRILLQHRNRINLLLYRSTITWRLKLCWYITLDAASGEGRIQITINSKQTVSRLLYIKESQYRVPKLPRGKSTIYLRQPLFTSSIYCTDSVIVRCLRQVDVVVKVDKTFYKVRWYHALKSGNAIFKKTLGKEFRLRCLQNRETIAVSLW